MFAGLRRVAALLTDPRVSKLPRAAVVLAGLYLLFPADLLPDLLIPVGGFLDDAVVLWTSLRWLLRSGERAGIPKDPEAR